MEQLVEPVQCGFNKVPATSFLTTLSANVDNTALSDSDFREFIRRSLDVVDFPRPSQEVLGSIRKN